MMDNSEGSEHVRIENGLSRLSLSLESSSENSSGLDLSGFFTDSKKGRGFTDAEDGIADDEWDCGSGEGASAEGGTRVLKRRQMRKKLGCGGAGTFAMGASAVSGSLYPSSPLSGLKTKSSPIEKEDGQNGDASVKNNGGGPRKGRTRRNLFKNQDDLREKAWRKKRDQILQSEESNQSDLQSSAGEEPRTPRVKDLELTNVDLDELKGCLDLGFGFTYDEIPELSQTLPALELCYAMGQQIQDDEHANKSSPTNNSSPTSSPEAHADSSISDGCVQSPTAHWKISNPGDHPQDVKARLKVWAQAVACTVRLCG
eukprot:TRINITY_DN9414_c0_g1_i1.p1 TRINITY_DN9414_c0_g1~~TRINITY_DN9414_c0_g1_i1.p1  ORF type:complete len:314 (-),score=83.93 TRINITY_DN9414_c0_g1_i1:634-1575(-)